MFQMSALARWVSAIWPTANGCRAWIPTILRLVHLQPRLLIKALKLFYQHGTKIESLPFLWVRVKCPRAMRSIVERLNGSFVYKRTVLNIVNIFSTCGSGNHFFVGETVGKCIWSIPRELDGRIIWSGKVNPNSWIELASSPWPEMQDVNSGPLKKSFPSRSYNI